MLSVVYAGSSSPVHRLSVVYGQSKQSSTLDWRWWFLCSTAWQLAHKVKHHEMFLLNSSATAQNYVQLYALHVGRVPKKKDIVGSLQIERKVCRPFVVLGGFVGQNFEEKKTLFVSSLSHTIWKKNTRWKFIHGRKDGMQFLFFFLIGALLQ